MAYIITNKSIDGRETYFDGFGFTLIRANAKVMDAATGVSVRSLICWRAPECRLVQN